MPTALDANDPRLMLANARELAQRVRRTQRATWFPLLVFAALTFASIPVQRYGGHHLDCQNWPGGEGGAGGGGARGCRVYSDAEYVYWPIGFVVAYLAIAALYVRRSRARGVGTRVSPYVIGGVIVAAACTGIAVWELDNPPLSLHVGLNLNLSAGLASPGAAVGLALLLLVWAERNHALAGLTMVYLLAVLVPMTAGRLQPYPPWYAIPQLWPGAVLLAGGVMFAVAQHPSRSAAS